ncbi:MAG: hypothetical protein ACFFDK_09870 [Promethearchaeota archaeon]
MIIDQKLEDQIKLLEKNFQEQVMSLTGQINEFGNKLGNITAELSNNLEIIQDQIKNQKNENITFNNEINELITKTTSKLDSEFKDIKGQQDVLKVSFDVLEKKILDEAKSMIYSEVRMVCKDKEDEILMNMWIDELKEIINDFDKLKEMNPKDLKIQVDEISQIIASFKKKFA